MEFHVQILSPQELNQAFHKLGYKDYNGDQDFRVGFESIDKLTSIPLENPYIQHIPAKKRAKEYVYLGMNVTPNIARGISTPENPYRVPVMLHYDDNQTIQVTLYNKMNEIVFDHKINYTLSPQYFQRPTSLNSKWKSVYSLDSQITIVTPSDNNKESLREKWNYVEQSEKSFICFSDDYSIMLIMTIQKVLNEQNEPLAFYLDREFMRCVN